MTWKQVAAFRLSRHNLVRRKPGTALASVLRDMGGAQSQLLMAGQMSIWARVKGVKLSRLDSALWKERTLAKAWCMRRTMFLVPSGELATFVRGSALRAEREIRWVLSKGVPARKLDAVVEEVLLAMQEPVTQSVLAEMVSRALHQKVKYAHGGGWGSRRKVPCVEVGGLTLPANYLLHLAGARGVYCSGPSIGNETTFVRADRWIPSWRDVPRREAEKELVTWYLRSFGPSTVSDFGTWTGMTADDAKDVWSRVEGETVQVDVEGSSGSVLAGDLEELQSAHLDEVNVRLLPFFDSFLLGHKSHRNIVSPTDHGHVYRPAGWVSPVLLVDGRAAGVWSYTTKNGTLQIQVRSFSDISEEVSSLVREEAAELGRFVGCAAVDVKTS
ncbi:MAG: AlkZ family DNA glycosylase [Nitrososphaerota archaeon]|nr:AlkZ family DNA glycosylase [Nitrososphaerota archaeon]